jgi:hypothetical protein
MGKYSEIVKSKSQSNEPENQKSVKVESNKTIKEQNSKTGNVESNKSGNQQNTITSNAENQKAVSEDMVNLSIKVPRRLRQKWVAESRLRGTTLTAIISDYLKTELGE